MEQIAHSFQHATTEPNRSLSNVQYSNNMYNCCSVGWILLLEYGGLEIPWGIFRILGVVRVLRTHSTELEIKRGFRVCVCACNFCIHTVTALYVRYALLCVAVRCVALHGVPRRSIALLCVVCGVVLGSH
jgi:hypothetical protein